MTIPVEMKPTNPGPANNDPYFCGNPGGATSLTSTSPSKWEFTPPSIDFNWVAAGGVACKATSDCGYDEICGNSFNPGHANLL